MWIHFAGEISLVYELSITSHPLYPILRSIDRGSHHQGAQRITVQLPQARHETPLKKHDLVREAVGWNGGLGRIV
jgi:hypothetical protein